MTTQTESCKPTFDPADLAPSLAEMSGIFALMAADFERMSKRTRDIAASVQSLQASGEAISQTLFAEMNDYANLFGSGTVPNYDFEPIERKCGQLGSLVIILSGKMKYEEGNFIDVKAA